MNLDEKTTKSFHENWGVLKLYEALAIPLKMDAGSGRYADCSCSEELVTDTKSSRSGRRGRLRATRGEKVCKGDGGEVKGSSGGEDKACDVRGRREFRGSDSAGAGGGGGAGSVRTLLPPAEAGGVTGARGGRSVALSALSSGTELSAPSFPLSSWSSSSRRTPPSDTPPGSVSERDGETHCGLGERRGRGPMELQYAWGRWAINGR